MSLLNTAGFGDDLTMQSDMDEQPADPSGVKETDLWRFYGFQEAAIGRNIQLCDAKASIVIVAISAVLTALVRDHQLGPAMSLAADMLVHFPARSGSIAWSAALACAAFVACGVGLALSLRVVAPRFRRGDEPDRKMMDSSVVSWLSISEFTSAGVYADRVLRANEDDLLKDAFCHLHDLSCVCRDKMRALSHAIRLGVFSILLPLAWLFLFGRGS